MPVRNYVAGRVAGKIVGPHVFSGPDRLSRTIADEQLYRAHEVADSIYVDIVNHVDWNRVLTEAHIVHMELDHENYESPCGTCVRAALLSDDRNWSWEKKDELSRREVKDTLEVDDWPAAVGEVVKYRR